MRTTSLFVIFSVILNLMPLPVCAADSFRPVVSRQEARFSAEALSSRLGAALFSKIRWSVPVIAMSLASTAKAATFHKTIKFVEISPGVKVQREILEGVIENAGDTLWNMPSQMLDKHFPIESIPKKWETFVELSRKFGTAFPDDIRHTQAGQHFVASVKDTFITPDLPDIPKPDPHMAMDSIGLVVRSVTDFIGLVAHSVLDVFTTPEGWFMLAACAIIIYAGYRFYSLIYWHGSVRDSSIDWRGSARAFIFDKSIAIRERMIQIKRAVSWVSGLSALAGVIWALPLAVTLTVATMGVILWWLSRPNAALLLAWFQLAEERANEGRVERHAAKQFVQKLPSALTRREWFMFRLRYLVLLLKTSRHENASAARSEISRKQNPVWVDLAAAFRWLLDVARTILRVIRGRQYRLVISVLAAAASRRLSHAAGVIVQALPGKRSPFVWILGGIIAVVALNLSYGTLDSHHRLNIWARLTIWVIGGLVSLMLAMLYRRWRVDAQIGPDWRSEPSAWVNEWRVWGAEVIQALRSIQADIESAVRRIGRFTAELWQEMRIVSGIKERWMTLGGIAGIQKRWLGLEEAALAWLRGRSNWTTAALVAEVSMVLIFLVVGVSMLPDQSSHPVVYMAGLPLAMSSIAFILALDFLGRAASDLLEVVIPYEASFNKARENDERVRLWRESEKNRQKVLLAEAQRAFDEMTSIERLYIDEAGALHTLTHLERRIENMRLASPDRNAEEWRHFASDIEKAKKSLHPTITSSPLGLPYWRIVLPTRVVFEKKPIQPRVTEVPLPHRSARRDQMISAALIVAKPLLHVIVDLGTFVSAPYRAVLGLIRGVPEWVEFWRRPMIRAMPLFFMALLFTGFSLTVIAVGCILATLSMANSHLSDSTYNQYPFWVVNLIGLGIVKQGLHNLLPRARRVLTIRFVALKRAV